MKKGKISQLQSKKNKVEILTLVFVFLAGLFPLNAAGVAPDVLLFVAEIALEAHVLQIRDIQENEQQRQQFYRVIAEKFAHNLLDGRWLDRWEKDFPPLIVFEEFQDFTSGDLDSELLSEKLQNELSDSPKLLVKKWPEWPQSDNQELKNRNAKVNREIARDSGADYMFIGKVRGNKKSGYKIRSELIDLKKNRKVWIGKENIRVATKAEAEQYRNSEKRLEENW